MKDDLLTLKDVSLSYYGTDFGICGINLRLQYCGRLVVYGREGSGKTLALRAIAGLEDSNFGDILLDGKKLKDIAVKDRGIGFTFDFSSLDKGKSVGQILEYPMTLRDYAQEDTQRSVDVVATAYGLDLSANVQGLSDFDKAKLLLARLFVLERKLYIVDDVWKDLPSEEQERIIDLLINSAKGKSVIVATQDIRFAKALGGEVVVFSGGECTAQMSLDEHSIRPVNMETAILCGYAIYKSVLKKDSTGYYAEIDGVRYSVESPLSDIYVDKEVCFAVGESGATGFYYDAKCERIISKNVDEH